MRDKYIPGQGKLRVIVITDGLDVRSPHPYNGIRGMDPMMQELLKDGYDIEWHIVVVDISRGPFFGQINKSDVSKYEALAESTGGGFLFIDEPGVMDDFSARHFLSSLEKAVRGGDKSILESEDFKTQRGKGGKFLSRLHASNRHIEDHEDDQKRRQKQLAEYKSSKKGASEMPWLPLLESTLKEKK